MIDTRSPDEVLNLHACAVAIGEVGVLITGASGAGKSRLVGALLAARLGQPVRLVADDRTLLIRRGDNLIARPHPLIAGKLELRGFGIVVAPTLDAAVIRFVVQLTTEPIPRLPDFDPKGVVLLGLSVPSVQLPAGHDAAQHFFTLWPYLHGRFGPLC